PINILDLRDRGFHLLAEGGVGNPAVVPGDADEAQIGLKSEALQQMLAKLKTEAGVDGRLQTGKFAVADLAAVVEGQAHVCTGGPALRVVEIGSHAVLIERGNAGSDGVGEREHRMLDR